MLKRLTPLLILAVGIAGFAILKLTRPEPPPVIAEERSWRVETLTVSLQSHQPELSLYGQVTAPRTVVLSAPVAARVARRPVEDGQRVGAGELLVALEQDDLDPLLAQAEAAVADLAAQLRSETIRYTNDLNAVESERDIVANAERQLERTRSLANQNLASRDQLENASDTLAQARLILVNRERSLQEHETREQSLRAQLKRAEAQLASTRRDLRRSEAVAPFDGVVTDVKVAPGDQVSQFQAMLSVYPVAGLELRARVPERYREELSRALASGESLQAVATDGDYRFRMVRFAGESDPSGTEAIFRLDGDAGALRPGALLPVVLQRPAIAGTVAVPYSAIYGNDRVYVVSGDERMVRIDVELAGELRWEDGERWALVTGGGLRAGQQLITTHLPNAIAGLKLDPVASLEAEPGRDTAQKSGSTAEESL